MSSWSSLPYKTRRAILLRLLIRDNWVCCICGLRIKRVSHASVEHKRPQSRGGGHDEANLGPAHRGCNYSRQDRATVVTVSDGRSFF